MKEFNKVEDILDTPIMNDCPYCGSSFAMRRANPNVGCKFCPAPSFAEFESDSTPWEPEKMKAAKRFLIEDIDQHYTGGFPAWCIKHNVNETEARELAK